MKKALVASLVGLTSLGAIAGVLYLKYKKDKKSYNLDNDEDFMFEDEDFDFE